MDLPTRSAESCSFRLLVPTALPQTSTGGRGYRRTALAAMAAAAEEQINGSPIIGGRLAPSGASKSAPQVVPN
jgi:hypothetical protein